MDYIAQRIAALQRNGAIKELRGEARKIRDAIVKHFDAADAAQRHVDYGWVTSQANRAQAFDVAAQELDNARPAGAAGLAS
jgi:hypothetical protein